MKNILKIAWFVFVLVLGGVFSAVLYKAGEWTGYVQGREAMRVFCDNAIVFKFEEGGRRYFCYGEEVLKADIPMME